MASEIPWPGAATVDENRPIHLMVAQFWQRPNICFDCSKDEIELRSESPVMMLDLSNVERPAIAEFR